MKKMQKINLLKKADVLNEKDMKLLIGGEKDACGGGGYHLYSCTWYSDHNPQMHAWVCATSLDGAWSSLEKTIYDQQHEDIWGGCADYK